MPHIGEAVYGTELSKPNVLTYGFYRSAYEGLYFVNLMVLIPKLTYPIG